MYSHLPFYFINVILHAGVYIYFIIMPFQSKLRCSRNKTIFHVTLWVLFTAVLDVIFFEMDAPMREFSLPAMLLWLVVTAAVMILTIRANLLQLIFVLFLIFSFQENLMMCARLIYAVDPLPPMLPWFDLFNYLFYTIVVMVLAFPFLWYLFHLFKKIIDTKIDFLQWKYLFFLPFTYYLYCTVSHFGGIDFADPGAGDFILLLLLNSFAYFSYISVMKMLLKVYDNYKMAECMNVMQKQLQMQKGQYEKLAENIKETSRQQHDWRHHLLVIKNYVGQGDREGLELYLNHYSAEYMKEEAPVCRNSSVDIILRHYLSIARSEDIETEVMVDIPKDFSISDYQLCIVFGNLVENAVEGCLKKNERRFLSIHAKAVGDQLAIMIQNNYEGTVKRNGEEFLSTKHEGSGVGLSSVKNIAEKSGGSFQVNYEKAIFKVSVFLCTS